MKNRFTLFLTFLLLSYVALAQEKDPVLLIIDKQPTLLSEFETVYKKNNREQSIDRKALEDYLDLYVNFKLKVRAAEELGLDTSAAFTSELQGYRRQLSQPYLTDNEVTESLINEAYERMKKDIRASHILVMLAPDASPKDTLKAWNTIMSIRDKAVKGGADFSALAKASSEDPSAKDNGGDLGYFSSLMMVYPFETAAYNTPVGQISMPVRTRYGYHLVKVTDIRPARGEVLIGHIMVSTQQNTSPEDSVVSRKRIFELHEKLKAGEEFEELARQHSDDRGSAAKGGQLPWFGTGRMVPEFEAAAYQLEKGNVSEPIYTRFGWHILKKYDQKGLSPFSEMKADLKTRISRDSRSEKSMESFVSRLKSEYNYKTFPKEMTPVYKAVDTTLLTGAWKAPSSLNSSKILFSLGDTSLTVSNFVEFLEKQQIRQDASDVRAATDRYFDDWVNSTIIRYEDNRLEKKYPAFRALMQEYRDGILLFDLTDDMVWSKAVKDTVGLEAFYQTVKNNYMWPQRLKATIYTAANEDIAKETLKLVKKAEKKGYSPEDIRKMVNTDSELNLRVESGSYSREDQPVLNKVEWKSGISSIIEHEGRYVIADVESVLNPQPKTLQEARGLITAEYQAKLEKDWIEALRSRYTIVVHRDVLDQIK